MANTIPLYGAYAQAARNYNSPAQAAANAGLATTDVANANNAANANTRQQLESYGIDPSQTRFQALDLGANISAAAQEAGAATNARMQTQQTGFNLENSALGAGLNLGSLSNAGFGTVGNALGLGNSSYASALQSVLSGNAGGINAATAGANLVGTPIQWEGVGANFSGQGSSSINSSANNALGAAQINSSAAGNLASGIGSAVGTGAGIVSAIPGGWAAIGGALAAL
jgi:hypothetical protein